MVDLVITSNRVQFPATAVKTCLTITVKPTAGLKINVPFDGSDVVEPKLESIVDNIHRL